MARAPGHLMNIVRVQFYFIITLAVSVVLASSCSCELGSLSLAWAYRLLGLFSGVLCLGSAPPCAPRLHAPPPPPPPPLSVCKGYRHAVDEMQVGTLCQTSPQHM